MAHIVDDMVSAAITVAVGLAGAWSCGRIASRYDLPRRTWMAIGFLGSLLAVLVLGLYVRIRFRGVPRPVAG